jgi:hypothetical protein
LAAARETRRLTKCALAVESESHTFPRPNEEVLKMTTFDAALTKHGNVTFVVVSVQDSVVNSPSEAAQVISGMSLRFGCPAVLMGSHSHKLYGRRDIVQFLSKIDFRRLPWKRWSAAA